ncbi:unnamed protein product [Dracunculus medinensis]|uniref:EOG090X09DI n=1 Tax=Dracunculus medinensis TaxID=318479 RepID=A0A0N4U2E8_DRAME|nr:unnamed protein product [Dracunculus medinensis]
MRLHEDLARKGSTNENTTTSISRSAFTVFSCRPVVLFCELLLHAGELREFVCTQQLPLESIPPSFKGHLVRYIYKLTLGVQHVKSPIKLLNIPLRVIQSDLGITFPSVPKLSNPFIANKNTGPSIIDLTTEATDCITAPHGSSSYAITNSRGKVASFFLIKKAFKLGEDIIGRFIFDNCEVRCLQYTVSLQSVETLVAENSDLNLSSFISTHVTEHAVCAYWREALVKLQIPLSATPTFYTDTVHLKWRLHFEFITNDDFKFDVVEGLSQAPDSLNIETMTWNLDIKVFPCNPHNAALTSTNFLSISSMTV